MVNLINQLNMPIIEVSMVIQNMLTPMLESLRTRIAETGMEVPDKVMVVANRCAKSDVITHL